MPNGIFHRAWDKLHSRCVEYPFAAAHLGDNKKILDVGTVKSDPVWIKWLESLPLEVHGIDFDMPSKIYKKVIFHKADLRCIPIESNTFDAIIAVSVIEHIGMEDPQVYDVNTPGVDSDGDIKAFDELLTVSKPNGKIIMTLPFGNLGNGKADQSTRIYSSQTIKRFETNASPILLEYYEYQYSRYLDLFSEYKINKGRKQRIIDILTEKKNEKLTPLPEKQWANNFGLVTWRKIPPEKAKATHVDHADGVICGIWVKKNK